MDEYDYFDPNYTDSFSLESNSEEFDPFYVNKADKNFEKYSVKVGKKEPNKKQKRVIVRNYGSELYGYVRNAADGSFYNMRVGSREEEQLFKVIVSDGRNGRRDPLLLYYDSPEQYESHHMTTVSQSTKDKWYKRHLLYV
jgi:hypothetical protein